MWQGFFNRFQNNYNTCKESYVAGIQLSHYDTLRSIYQFSYFHLKKLVFKVVMQFAFLFLFFYPNKYTQRHGNLIIYWIKQESIKNQADHITSDYLKAVFHKF